MNHCLTTLMCNCLIMCALCVASLAQSPSRVTKCLPEQSSLLLQLKREFLFDESRQIFLENTYPKMRHWRTGQDCCEWDGVTCDAATGEVTQLDISSSWVYGTLRPDSSLFSLLSLRRLNLAYNNFNHSRVPSALGRLSRLTHLNLSNTRFRGHIPREIGWMTNLVSLDLSSYNSILFESLNFSYRNLTNLKVLHLDQLNVSLLPLRPLANLSSLSSLSLISCDLRGEFPEDVFQLPEIEAINLSWNEELNGSLPEFRSGSKLKSLVILYTQFSGSLPDSIGNLKYLNVLYLHNFEGNIPSSLGNLSQLKILDLGSDFRGQLPSTLGNLSQLTKFSLIGNFNGLLPSSLGNLVKLNTLALSSSDVGFTGELPSSFGNLKRLEVLDISSNSFRGSIPSLRNLSQLTSLVLTSNDFDGKFPLGLTNLSRLSDLDMSENFLNGEIPSSLFTMVSLFSIHLQANQFSGPLTVPKVSSSQLVELTLSENKLSGRVPSSISELKSLESLNLDSNKFRGTIEFDTFSNLSSLVRLSLSSNSLSVKFSRSNLTLPKLESLKLSFCNISEFPNFLKTQDSLDQLDLSDNKLEGAIPEWFFSVGTETLQFLNLSHNSISSWEQAPFILPWKNLQHLDIHSNAFVGSLKVPPFSTKYLFISDNEFSGNIPQLFCNLTDLVILEMSSNNLSGTIPQCLGSVARSLLVLNLRRNNFHGKIPQTFLERSQLKTMDLSHNELEGKVPQSLINCTSLEVLNLGHNQITDTFPFWLQNLPELKVLVLRMNKFHNNIWNPLRFLGFGKLRIVDLSFNNFSGRLPPHFFKNWSAMSSVAASDDKKLMYMKADINGYYHDSVTLVNKGTERVLERILTIFTAIDLSNNNFSGEIPTSIGDLQSLIVLNLSANNFVGFIPTSLGSLSELESLDLAHNKLSGRIPQELASLTFLQHINLSHNQLMGLIPKGRHFDTFPNSSFVENPDLCGFPLSTKCEDEAPSAPNHNRDSESESGFGWKSVLVGYASGFRCCFHRRTCPLLKEAKLVHNDIWKTKKVATTKWPFKALVQLSFTVCACN